MSPASRSWSGQRGAALIAALLVFALSAAVLVSLEKDSQLFYQRMSNGLIHQQTKAYLLGAEQLGIALLALDQTLDAESDSPRDTLLEMWAQASPPYPIEGGGMLAGRLQDLEGRFNLNNLIGTVSATGESSNLTIDQAVFLRLLLTLENEEGALLQDYEARSLVQAIGDWLDADRNPRIDGAEDLEYQSRQPPYRAANQPMVSPSELMAVRGMTPEIYDALQDVVTVWPRDGSKINIHTAPPPILRALPGMADSRPLSLLEIEPLLQLRESEGFESVEELLQHPIFKDNVVADLATMLDQQSNTFLLIAEASVADRRQQLYSVVSRANGGFEITMRVEGRYL
ncbi:MAG: type II secretion system minor pseudopilin GspK [Proteobacteria bacterium]|nr:type II secretion system minor pseudopilin GspK [Pseudomonadota bacterium]MDA0953086.1 type II secretion system minor pseudopilin GspK [Pseudomonadota bacterium]